VRAWLWIALAMIGLSGCATTGKKPVAPPKPEPLIIGQHDSPPFLNVSIATFVNENMGKSATSRIYAPIREAEVSYLPVLLRNTLNNAGHWGAVRVSPEPNPSSEVQVTAKVLASTALELKLHVTVVDSRGATWIDKDYDEAAGPQTYAGDIGDDAFQSLFNQIANDMYRALPAVDAKDLLRASALRYAISLSPQTFSRYLKTDNHGIMQVVGLPAQDDKMYHRVAKIRAAEYKFEDVMDDQYSAFYDRLRTTYPYWQQLSYELLHYNRHLNTTGSKSDIQPRVGTWSATRDVYDTFKEYKLNEDELRELATTFKSETHRNILALEGQVIELNGPLQDQYKKWRKILDQIYSLER